MSKAEWFGGVSLFGALLIGLPVAQAEEMHSAQTSGAQAGPQAMAQMAGEEWDKQRLLDDALSAAPPAMAETARVEDWDGTVLREGSSDWTCMPTMPHARAAGTAPMCLDSEWKTAMTAVMNKDMSYKPSQLGIAYMLAGDVGTSNVDPYASGPTADNQWVVEGPHLMILVPDSALLAGLPKEPAVEGPYVMFPDTPFAHIMVPTGERPEQPVAMAPEATTGAQTGTQQE